MKSYRTDNVKSPGLLVLGRAKKLPSQPKSIKSFSASSPVKLGWNHLQKKHCVRKVLSFKRLCCKTTIKSNV